MRIGVHGNIRLVVKLASAAVKIEERDLGPCLPAIERLGYRYLGTLNRVEEAIEEDDNVGIVHVALRVKGDAGVRTKINAIGAHGRRERQVHRAPAFTAVTREIATHRQTNDFTRRSPGSVAFSPQPGCLSGHVEERV